MSAESASPTDLLIAWGQGEREACNRLMPLVYAELRGLAGRYMRRERPGYALQATALANEIYLRLVDVKRNWRAAPRMILFPNTPVAMVFSEPVRPTCPS